MLEGEYMKYETRRERFVLDQSGDFNPDKEEAMLFPFMLNVTFAYFQYLVSDHFLTTAGINRNS